MRVPRRAAAPLLTLAVLVTAAPAAGAGSRPLPEGWIVDRVRFEPLDPAGAPMVAEGVGQYRGALEVRPGLIVLNDVALDDYLKGISEVPTSWPAEAQRAQAVA